MEALTRSAPGRLRWVPITLVLVVVACGLAPVLRNGFGPDAGYILRNARGDARQRLFAWNAEAPSQPFGYWYSGEVFQRRFVRVLPSALVSLELSTLGARPFRINTVQLGIHLLNLLLGYLLLRTWLERWGAALVVLIVGLHLPARELVGWIGGQPTLVATTCLLACALALRRYRARPSATALLAIAATSLALVTSYEAAIFAPALLAGVDYVLTRGQKLPAQVAWRPRLALVAPLPLFALLSWWNGRDVTAHEASYRAGLAELWRVARVDLGNYLLKSLFVVRSIHSYDLYDRFGEWPFAVALLVLLALVTWWARRHTVAWLGLVVYFGFLVPPLLVRACCSTANVPSFRQLYLPHCGLAMILGALFTGPMRARHLVAAASFAVLAIATVPPPRDLGAVHAAVTQAAGEGARDIALVGQFDCESPSCRKPCGYDIDREWPGHPQWRLVPLSTEGEAPELTRVDDRTFQARVHGVFAIPVQRELDPGDAENRYPIHLARTWIQPPLQAGPLRFGEATIRALAQDADGIHALEYRLDRPLSEYVFLEARGCGAIRRLAW
jgi:hypothetical protein